MRADALAALLAIMCGHPRASSPVTPVTRVTPPVLRVTEPVTGARGKRMPPVTPATELQVESPRVTGVAGVTGHDAQGGNDDCSPDGAPATDFAEPDTDAIEERAGLAADRVPSVYLDAWARLNCQRPFDVSQTEWRRALDDGGLFLDAFGDAAAQAGWTPGEHFDVTAGLVWRLSGRRVNAFAWDHAWLNDGRIIFRRELKGFR